MYTDLLSIGLELNNPLTLGNLLSLATCLGVVDGWRLGPQAAKKVRETKGSKCSGQRKPLWWRDVHLPGRQTSRVSSHLWLGGHGGSQVTPWSSTVTHTKVGGGQTQLLPIRGQFYSTTQGMCKVPKPNHSSSLLGFAQITKHCRIFCLESLLFTL